MASPRHEAPPLYVWLLTVVLCGVVLMAAMVAVTVFDVSLDILALGGDPRSPFAGARSLSPVLA